MFDKSQNGRFVIVEMNGDSSVNGFAPIVNGGSYQIIDLVTMNGVSADYNHVVQAIVGYNSSAFKNLSVTANGSYKISTGVPFENYLSRKFDDVIKFGNIGTHKYAMVYDPANGRPVGLQLWIDTNYTTSCDMMYFGDNNSFCRMLPHIASYRPKVCWWCAQQGGVVVMLKFGNAVANGQPVTVRMMLYNDKFQVEYMKVASKTVKTMYPTYCDGKALAKRL